MKRKSTYGKKFLQAWIASRTEKVFSTKADALYWYRQGWRAHQSAYQLEIEKAYKKLKDGSPTETNNKGSSGTTTKESE